MNDTDTDTIVMTVHYNVTRTMSLTRTIHSSSMTWEKTDLQFHVDASTLCLLPGIPIPQNLEVVSAKTCARAMFVLSSETQHLGDVVRWNYKPVDGDVNAQKTLGVVIWNT